MKRHPVLVWCEYKLWFDVRKANLHFNEIFVFGVYGQVDIIEYNKQSNQISISLRICEDAASSYRKNTSIIMEK